MDSELIDLLRDDLRAATFTTSGVAAFLGDDADAARNRGVFAPARRVLAAKPESQLSLLIRCFLLGEELTAGELDAALPHLGATGAHGLGLVAGETPQAETSRAVIGLNPVAIAESRADAPIEWWILSDLDDHLRRGPAREDHVMGVGGATRSLIAQIPESVTVHDTAGAVAELAAEAAATPRLLDLGTGCGVVALHLALRGRVVATDISERALRFARANVRLNGLAAQGFGPVELRSGSLFAPVHGETFDLIVSNPPFVITPRDPAAPRYEYRDGGLTGDALVAEVIAAAPAHLVEGGTLLCLANWESPWGENGLERVRGWITATAEHVGPLSAWIIERDRLSPVQYAETWSRDGGLRPGNPAYDALVDLWLADFSERRVTAIGLGAVRLRREAQGTGQIHVDQALGAYAAGHRTATGSLAQDLAAAFAEGVAAAEMTDAAVLETRWIRDARVSEERTHVPGEESPQSIALLTDAPIARRVAADPLLAAAVGASDGDLTMGQIADALAQILEVDAAAARAALIAGVRELAWLGMLARARS